MDIKGRLGLIVRKVPQCQVVCDIGTDHAYIPIYLTLNGICEKAIATDVREGPLMIARENIAEYGLEEKIETRQGDGLESIRENEADVIVIAGMGGVLITEILEKRPMIAQAADEIILQPMNAIELVREWLYNSGFMIHDEELVSEGTKIYTVMCVRWSGVKRTCSEPYYHIGEKLIENHDELLGEYIDRKLRQLDSIISEIRQNSCTSSETGTKYEVLRNELDAIRRKL